jgi:hypothetical protein
MKISRRGARVLLSICLLVLQAQLFAASALGCGHLADNAPGEELAPSCPFHQGGDDQPGDQESERLLACQKCALHCAIGVHAAVPAVPDLPGVPVRSALELTRHGHYYSFTPDSFLKPPIS